MKEYKNCPICNGEIKYREDIKDYNENDKLVDIFECLNCKTMFYGDGESDFLYKYFNANYNQNNKEKIVTIKMPYDDLGDTTCVFEDWLNNINYSKCITRENVARIYYRLVNIWGDNAKDDQKK